MTDAPKNLLTLRKKYESEAAIYSEYWDDKQRAILNTAHDAYINAIRREIWEKVEPMLAEHANATIEIHWVEMIGSKRRLADAKTRLNVAIESIRAAIVGGGE